MKLAALLLTTIFCLGCVTSRASGGPGEFAPGSGPAVGADQVSLIAESFDYQGTLTQDWPLGAEVTVDSVAGTLSFYGLNGHCDGNNTATVGYLSSAGGPLLIWDFQSRGDKPVNVPVQASFPGGVQLSTLHFQAYNDLCTPTDFRIAVTFHRVKELK